MASASPYVEMYVKEVGQIAEALDRNEIEKMIGILAGLRETRGRLFILGVGGGAGNAAHAVNDFRKIAGIETYAPTDNVSELTARVNDDGWDTTFSAWLRTSRLCADDVIFVFSVGGGSQEKGVSMNIVRALEYAKNVGARVIGIIGRDGGYTGRIADARVIIPTVNPATVTPHTEAFQAVVWHLLVSHPGLRASEMKWESTI